MLFICRIVGQVSNLPYNALKKSTKANLTLRNFKFAVVVRTLVRIGCKRTEVRATLKKLPKT